MAKGLRQTMAGAVLAVVWLGLAGAAAAQDAAAEWQEDEAMAQHLADLLRAGRGVVSSRQAQINDPEVGDKGFTGDALVGEAETIFSEQYGAPPAELGLPPEDMALLQALTEAMRTVVDDHQDDINQPGVGFKGFIPAVFSRMAGEQFASIAGTQARIRVTAPPELVRNRKARPDAWEAGVISTRFTEPDWPEGQAYSEAAEVEGRPAFRMMLPEYYRESCLECHGGPEGEVDITGYPKEGGAAGDLGGVISITIFQ